MSRLPVCVLCSCHEQVLDHYPDLVIVTVSGVFQVAVCAYVCVCVCLVRVLAPEVFYHVPPAGHVTVVYIDRHVSVRYISHVHAQVHLSGSIERENILRFGRMG